MNEEWKPHYRFTLEAQFPADYEVSSWYLCNHPGSFFRQMLISARVTPESRYALLNNQLAIHRRNGTEKREFHDAAALRSCLEGDLALRLPESCELNAALERVCRAAAEPTTGRS